MAEPWEAKRSEELLNKYKGHVECLEHSLNAAQPSYSARSAHNQPSAPLFSLCKAIEVFDSS